MPFSLSDIATPQADSGIGFIRLIRSVVYQDLLRNVYLLIVYLYILARTYRLVRGPYNSQALGSVSCQDGPLVDGLVTMGVPQSAAEYLRVPQSATITNR